MALAEIKSKVDPITLEINKNALISTCKEMGATMVRTAYSPIFSEGRDFSTALFDQKCEMIAQGVGCRTIGRFTIHSRVVCQRHWHGESLTRGRYAPQRCIQGRDSPA